MRFTQIRRAKERGAALLTAMIFSFVVVTIMGSYLYLVSTEYRLSSRSYLYGASFNLAEGGIELALDALNANDSTGWSTGTVASGDSYWARAYKNYDLGRNITGDIRIVILNPNSSAPEIFTEGLAEGHLTGDVAKQLRVALSSGFYPFLNGFNSKKKIVLSGNNVTFDSYDSRNGSYGGGNVNSDITVATISVEVDAASIGNADVYGYVATGAAQPNVGPRGSITDYANPGRVDQSRITTDFYAKFPDVSAPSLTSPSTSLPTSGVVTGGDYLLSSWSSAGKNTLTITGDTRIVVTGDMSMSGKAAIRIDSSANVEIYVKGNASIGGNGILNASQKPEQLLVFGTNTSAGGQDIKVAGNGYLSAAVYAPNAVVELKGGGSVGRVFGAVAAYDAKLTGNSHFSYDEALGGYNLGGSGYAVEEWVELVGVSLTTLQINMADFGL
ncbi:MAG: DUF7305 domain-containing protein [Opitutaceae bacterium]